ncbi:hypothetical protein U8P75_16465 [Rhizobium beringeri]|nr:hypothetical protein U8P75_16465 [Rhizobium beringeri]
MASSTALSQDYHQRLEDVLKTCNPAEIPSYNSRFSRQWFAERIGCSVNTLSTSARLRTTLVNWEKQQQPTITPRTTVEDDTTNVVPFRRRMDLDHHAGVFEDRERVVYNTNASLVGRH